MVYKLNEDWESWAAGKVRYLRRRASGQAAEAGIWRGTPADIPAGTPIAYKRIEYIYIIVGSLRLEHEDGTISDLVAGDCYGFEKGDVVKWTITSDEFEEFYVYHD